MKFITGGFAQGKLRYAQNKYRISEAECLNAASASAEEWRTARLIYNLQDYIRAHHQGITCELPSFREDVVMICDEVGCGVVPLSPGEREFREASGRICCHLAEKAETVELLRCGIARRIK